MLSYWESPTFTHYDFVIVGGGIVGLSTAASLLERSPKAQVLILEQGLLPSGASTKNAGFACFGSLSELVSDRKSLSEQEVVGLVQARWKGLQQLRQRLGDAALQYQNLGGYELITEAELPCLEQLDRVNDWLMPLFGKAVFALRDIELTEKGFAQPPVKHLVYNPFEGQLHPGEMMKALWQFVRERGGTLMTGAKVISYDEQNSRVGIRVTQGQEPLHISAKQLAICTNAFTRKLLPDIELLPGRGQVLVTEPLARLPFRGVYHYQQGYFYFRNVGRRVLLGGGRNLDLEGESSLEFQTTAPIMNALEDLLRSVILPGTNVAISHRWAGIMAFGPDKRPICQRLSPRVALGVRLGGMGVAIGSGMGEQVAGYLLEA